MRTILRDLFRLDEGQDLLVLKPRDNQVAAAAGGAYRVYDVCRGHVESSPD